MVPLILITQDKEKPTVEEISTSSVDKIVPDIEHVSNDMAEQQSSSAGGQDDLKATGSDGTGLTGVPTGLTGTTGLTGAKIGLTGVSCEPESSSKSKIRPSFKELLAKYEKQGATQKKK